jgi:hypothetical protein
VAIAAVNTPAPFEVLASGKLPVGVSFWGVRASGRHGGGTKGLAPEGLWAGFTIPREELVYYSEREVFEFVGLPVLPPKRDSDGKGFTILQFIH